MKLKKINRILFISFLVILIFLQCNKSTSRTDPSEVVFLLALTQVQLPILAIQNSSTVSQTYSVWWTSNCTGSTAPGSIEGVILGTVNPGSTTIDYTFTQFSNIHQTGSTGLFLKVNTNCYSPFSGTPSNLLVPLYSTNGFQSPKTLCVVSSDTGAQFSCAKLIP